MIFLLALVLNGFTNSFGMSTHGQLTSAEQAAVEAFREADVDHSGTLSKAEVVQHFNEEQAEVRLVGARPSLVSARPLRCAFDFRPTVPALGQHLLLSRIVGPRRPPSGSQQCGADAFHPSPPWRGRSRF